MNNLHVESFINFFGQKYRCHCFERLFFFLTQSLSLDDDDSFARPMTEIFDYTKNNTDSVFLLDKQIPNDIIMIGYWRKIPMSMHKNPFRISCFRFTHRCHHKIGKLLNVMPLKGWDEREKKATNHAYKASLKLRRDISVASQSLFHLINSHISWYNFHFVKEYPFFFYSQTISNQKTKNDFLHKWPI